MWPYGVSTIYRYARNLHSTAQHTNTWILLINVHLHIIAIFNSIECTIFHFAGANSFGFYAVKIFRQTFAGMNPHGGAIAVGFVNLLAAMLSGLLIDTVGRIPLLIISSVFMSLALASFGSYVYYEQANKLLIASTNFDMETAAVNTDWIPLLCVLVFTIAFSLGKQSSMTRKKRAKPKRTIRN